MKTTTTALPAPHGPSAADLITWWHLRSDVGGTSTERRYTAVASTVLDHVALHTNTALTAIDMRAVNVEQLLGDYADCVWPDVSTSTRNNYANSLRRAVAEFLTALDDPAAVRPSRARVRLDAIRAGQHTPQRNGAPTMTAITELETTIGTTTNGGPRITRIWHCGEHTVRACVALDSNRPQSYALAEVLTPAYEWTKVCETAPEEFHWDVFSKRRPGANKVTHKLTEDELLALADDLMRRAAIILRVPTA